VRGVREVSAGLGGVEVRKRGVGVEWGHACVSEL
jgi:hypothetical protein